MIELDSALVKKLKHYLASHSEVRIRADEAWVYLYVGTSECQAVIPLHNKSGSTFNGLVVPGSIFSNMIRVGSIDFIAENDMFLIHHKNPESITTSRLLVRKNELAGYELIDVCRKAMRIKATRDTGFKMSIDFTLIDELSKIAKSGFIVERNCLYLQQEDMYVGYKLSDKVQDFCVGYDSLKIISQASARSSTELRFSLMDNKLVFIEDGTIIHMLTIMKETTAPFSVKDFEAKIPRQIIHLPIEIVKRICEIKGSSKTFVTVGAKGITISDGTYTFDIDNKVNCKSPIKIQFNQIKKLYKLFKDDANVTLVELSRVIMLRYGDCTILLRKE